jgi:hypothetical protein
VIRGGDVWHVASACLADDCPHGHGRRMTGIVNFDMDLVDWAQMLHADFEGPEHRYQRVWLYREGEEPEIPPGPLYRSRPAPGWRTRLRHRLHGRHARR